MTSATEILRRLLDERGVEWEAFDDFEPTTLWSTHNGAFVYWARERDGKLLVETTAPTKCSAFCTPEQAIAATLWPGTCVPVLDSERDNQPYLKPRFVCSECGCQLTESRLGKVWQNYCPNCGRRIEQ